MTITLILPNWAAVCGLGMIVIALVLMVAEKWWSFWDRMDRQRMEEKE